MAAKKSPILSLFVLLSSCVPAFADYPPSARPEPPKNPDAAPATAPAATVTPEKKALILELLKITDADKQVDQIVRAMMDSHQRQYPQIVAQVINSDPGMSEEHKKQLIDKMQENSIRSSERMKEIFLAKINLGEIMNEVAMTVYDKNFTDQELKDIIAFYKTTTGKRSLQVMPKVMKESMAMTSTLIMPKMQGVITQLMQEERTRLQAPPQASESKTTETTKSTGTKTETH